ncbi:GDSL-type esterase/lipase family protein [Microbacterium azadirachtae]|uniref:D-inositol 3-phosphate glycosyltransferase n=1 Tax=Microbacterium azadirachtae TaxID=582680 RepID=A0A0F0LH10_9MICO|nr:GDSL-type esterase/lipase family protein [Microbacterium azadirachtae]KJL30821.1 GDP-mannose-dependent alpha-mannosyltransferase [Microbacterium azadirachtae]
MTESFLPHMNGVTGSVLQILRHLERHGHEARVYAPAAADMPRMIGHARIEAIPSVALPGYRTVRVGTSSTHRLSASLARFAPDVVHLASPFALGWRGALAAERIGVPAVAAYQTDVAAYAARYGVSLTTALAEAHIARLHRRATLTLAPSSESEEQLARLGVDRVRRWGRGVDAERFHPDRRLGAWEHRADAEAVVGYVGRLAPEKQVEDLRALADLPGVRLVIVGDGPSRPRLESLLPDAVFLGHLSGPQLAQAMASFDVFVHPGESETFGQTLQEAHASGIPVVATGRGGPVDLVRQGIDGWLYRPGDLEDLRERVRDLAGDVRKRQAFGRAGREAVEGRSWSAVCDQLLGHFVEAQELHRADAGLRAPRAVRPEPTPAGERKHWRRYIALGDSLTEGLCDPGPEGELRGWADRLALLLAAREPLDYANLAIRSKRVGDVCGSQLDRALQLRPDLVSILVGANDLVKQRVSIPLLATRLEDTVRQLREAGADVLLVTAFLPGNPAARVYVRRFSAWATALAGIARRQGAILLDTDLHPQLAERPNWGEDLVHLSSRGHRFLAYRAGVALGVPLADELGALDEALHAAERTGAGVWWRRHALPWVWRRLHGRAAGDGRSAKHHDYVRLGRERGVREPSEV